MITTQQIAKMSREEKLQTMEALWTELSREEASLASPSWHKSALQETKKKVDSGDEKITEWASAKQDLRSRFQ